MDQGVGLMAVRVDMRSSHLLNRVSL